MLSYTVLYFTLVAVCVCRVTHTASNGQDEKCERLHCIFVQRNDANTIFNCSISTWAPVSGKLCVQPDRRLENPQCTHVVVDESGITANISEDKYTFIKVFN